MITGNTLMEWGYTPGKWFSEALPLAQRMEEEGASTNAIISALEEVKPPDPIQLQNSLDYNINLDAEDEDEKDNLVKVRETMEELMKTPTVRCGSVMPDACPAGGVGTIPVGGVVGVENAIHPGMHSADICCSVAISVLGDVKPEKVLDRAMEVTHFGGGGRPDDFQIEPPDQILSEFTDNPFLKGLEEGAIAHFGTQGDGNHFLFVGRLKSTGEVAVVTHHGSRKPGALLYKRGMIQADKFRKEISPETLKENSWLPMDSKEGRDYWRALQTIRKWTKGNHFAIHDLIDDSPTDRWWNEHNFVFERNGLFYHGKGATPAWEGFAEDSNGLTLIPLNMAEPVLITRGLDAKHGLGFCPHGAGRNFSRREHSRRLDDNRTEKEIVREETEGLDIRFYSGYPDTSELPSAYKNATTVRNQIDRYGLAEVVDEVEPYGCIMAGNWKRAFRKK